MAIDPANPVPATADAILAAINPAARPDIISLGHIDAMLHIAEPPGSKS
jgi:hypothetical protein